MKGILDAKNKVIEDNYITIKKFDNNSHHEFLEILLLNQKITKQKIAIIDGKAW